MKDIIGLILAILILLGGCSSESESSATVDKEYIYDHPKTQIRMHDDAAPVLEALGEPLSSTEQASCAFDGLEITYCFGSFYMSTYPDGDIERIYSLWFADDSAATAEGLRIGDPVETLETLYGISYRGEKEITLEGTTGKLKILLSDNMVTSIQYEAIPK